MQINVYGIQARLEGDGVEQIHFWLNDLSSITDLVGNHLAESTIVGNLHYYDYVSKAEKETVEAGGNGIKYMILTLFSTNLLLKILISSSAALMWSLIHALQVFRYILMINVDMPKIVDTLMKYIAIVVGDIDDVEESMPDWFTKYVVNSTELSVNATLYERFEENGYDTPFFALLFSKQITLVFGLFLISLPFIYFGKTYLKKIPWVSNNLNSLWISFFWNVPVKTLTELYIEICLAFFLNFLNIQFSSASGVIWTLIMYVVALFILTWPFVLLNIITTPPKILKRPEFGAKYGTLTEDFFLARTLYQRSYYIAF